MLRMMKIGGQDCPVVMCDVCHQRIVNAGDGAFYWATDEAGEMVESGRILFLHGACSKAFEDANYHLDWCHLPLECLPICLGDNLNLDWQAARARADKETGS